MAQYLYNGVLLPEIPADVLAEYPYATIILRTNGTYRLLVSKNGFFKQLAYDSVDEKSNTAHPTYLCSNDTASWSQENISNTAWSFASIIWSSHDIPNGSATATEIYFYGSEPVDPNAPEEPTEEVFYKISGERLTAIADQVRRISGVTDELTPEQIETNLLNVTVGAELPTAEESIFGVNSGDTEYGILVEGNSASAGTLSSFVTFGWKFTVAEAFSIIGFRVKDNKAAYRKINLWDSSGNIVVSVEKNDMASDWVSYYLDSPINVAIDETYTITTYSYVPDFINVNSTSFNPKLKNIEVRQANTDVFPTSSNYYSKITLVDIIIAPVQAELPDIYQVQRNTMDDIAEEVQRITGATDKLSTAQIINALQGIEAQTT